MKYVIYMNGEEPTTAIQEIIERECGRECEVIAAPDKKYEDTLDLINNYSYFNILRKYINKHNIDNNID